MNRSIVHYQSVLSTLKIYNYPLFFQSTRKYPATPKRFYRKVDVISNGNNSYEITLDKKKVKTPGGNVLKLYNETLAFAIATEWDAQKDIIQRSSMHLTALCNTVIDNPNKTDKHSLITNLLNFLDTDTVLYYSDEDNELYKLQLKEWMPILDWFNEKFQTNINPVRGISFSCCSEDVKQIFEHYLNSYSFPCLHGLTLAVENLKSIILSVCCLNQKISIEKAVLLSRLEEEYQTENWGRIEWSHDLNLVDLQSRVSAALTFIHLNSEFNVVKTM